ncbi:facilitated trehalose transporter Tret1-like [Diorhabda sublineata]|uniref:facilitated trehalose transporter Tret1-like n=1 Tax=Diorhabda sublineata TaxID=1163346 RepID=UPI0024E103CA|nr:facilitated trehalose transporter Tret1-like [Diorhabda sublineata]
MSENSNKAKILPQYIASICICLGALGMGTVLGWSSNITQELLTGELNGIKMGTHELGWVGSCCTIGAMIMCFPAGFIADHIGRKPTCLLTAFPFVFGWLLILFAQNVYMLYAGRIITGASGGSFVVLAPIYTTEIAQIHHRGALGSFMQYLLVIGIFYSNLFGWILSMYAFNVVNTIIPIIFAVLFFFQPETPFYYIQKGNNEKAAQSFARLRGKNYDYKEELDAMIKEIENRRQYQDFKVAIKAKSAKKSTIICFSLMFFQQMSGVNAVLFYAKHILMQSETHIDVRYGVVGIGIISLISITIGVWTTDYFGRTILLMASSAGCSLSTFLLGFYFTIKDRISEDAIKPYGLWPIICVLCFVFSFQLGLGSLPWLACSEIFSPELKAKLGAPAGSFNYLTAFIVTKCFYPVSENLGVDIAFYIFAFVSLIACLFTLLIIPETKHKTFEETIPELEKFWKYF